MSGAIPSCSKARSRSAPAMNDSTDHASYDASTRRRTRSATDVITPSVPSDPRTSSRSDGPAAEPGASNVDNAPEGVTHDSATTCSSIRPCPVEVCPADRVAAHPPTVAHS